MSTLSETNPYLKDKETARLMNQRSTRTSCGVEGIEVHELGEFIIKPDTSKTDAIFRKIQSRLREKDNE